jgi:transcription termination/antitermination protein NusG
MAETQTESQAMRWYAVQTHSGFENRARASLLERVRTAGLQHWFGEVLIPTESVVEVVRGHRRTATRKFYPGYLFVQMELTDETYHLVKNTPKVAGFLGEQKGTRPTPVPDEQIQQAKTQMTEGAIRPRPRIHFEESENVRVTDGPFAGFSGVVEEVKSEKQKVRVLVSIFGRATPVELDYAQVEKA